MLNTGASPMSERGRCAASPGNEHFARNLGVASFVRIEERVSIEEHEPGERRERCKPVH